MSCNAPKIYNLPALIEGNYFKPFSIGVQLNDEDADLSGIEAELVVKASPDSESDSLSLTIGSGLTVDGSTIIVDPNPVELEPGTYVYEFSLTWDGLNLPITYIKGTWRIDPAL